jgi:hypothetical protein
MTDKIRIEQQGAIRKISLARPEVRWQPTARRFALVPI